MGRGKSHWTQKNGTSKAMIFVLNLNNIMIFILYLNNVYLSVKKLLLLTCKVKFKHLIQFVYLKVYKLWFLEVI